MGELLYDGINAMSLCAAKSPAERQKVIQATRLGTDQRFRCIDIGLELHIWLQFFMIKTKYDCNVNNY